MKGLLDYNWMPGDEFFVPNEEIAKLALEMWDLFDLAKKKYSPKHRRSPDKAAPYFYKAAYKARMSGISAATYVDRAVKRMAEVGKLWPQALASAAVDTALTNGEAEETHEILAHYVAMQALLHGRASVLPLRYVLDDEAVQLSPLFRYAVAKHNGFTDLLPRWQKAAEREYGSAKIIAELFRGVI